MSLRPPSAGRLAETTARNGRRPQKVVLAPGHSPMDWARLKSSNADLRGPPSDDPAAQMGRITRQELARHNSKEDAWTALGGKVYNITPYLPFHPGGPEQLMRAAGGDGTKLFAEYHGWVNYEHMLDKSCVGIFIG